MSEQIQDGASKSDNGALSKPNPLEDGVTHINVWSKGKTALGRMLSNFAHTPFKHPVHGFFASMEAYWYWCATGRSHDELRRLYGASAKTMGLKFDNVPWDPTEFHETICEGIRCKIEQTIELRQMLRDSVLPLKHYFVYGARGDVVVDKPEHQWQLDYIEQIRRELKAMVLPTTETQVVLADGTCKPVEEIKPGDTLRTVSDTDGNVAWDRAEVLANF